MNDADFLRTIQAEPSDAVLQLVFADWLDGQGDPRGQLIRLLVEVRNQFEQHDLWDEFIRLIRSCFGSAERKHLYRRIDKSQQRLFACDCASSVLHYFEMACRRYDRLNNKSSVLRMAIAVARRYAKGTANDEELLKAEMVVGEIAVYTATLVEMDLTDVDLSVRRAVWAIAAAVSDDPWAASNIEDDGRQLTWLVERVLAFRTD